MTSTPSGTTNWKAESGQQWTVPVGGGAGRLMRLGRQPVDFKLMAFWNVEKPRFGPDYSVQFTVKLLFPK